MYFGRCHVINQVGDVIGSLDHIANDADEADLMESQVIELEHAVLVFDLRCQANRLTRHRHNLSNYVFLEIRLKKKKNCRFILNINHFLDLRRRRKKQFTLVSFALAPGDEKVLLNSSLKF